MPMGLTGVRAQKKRQNGGQYVDSWPPISVVNGFQRTEEGEDPQSSSRIVLGWQGPFYSGENRRFRGLLHAQATCASRRNEKPPSLNLAQEENGQLRPCLHLPANVMSHQSPRQREKWHGLVSLVKDGSVCLSRHRDMSISRYTVIVA